MESIFVLDPEITMQKQHCTPLTTDSSYFDTHLNCTVLATTPRARPELWRAFTEGALASYTHFGVEKALEYEEILDGISTTIFLAAVDDSGRLHGGLRVQGPYTQPTHTHAEREWADCSTGRAALRRMVAERLPHGVVEMKSVWTAQDAPRQGTSGYLGAIGATLAAVALGSRFTLATSAEHAMGPYLDSGAVMAAHIDAVPYPDDRYRTRVLWWDQHMIPRHTTVNLYRHIARAVAQLLPTHHISTEAPTS